MKQELFTTPPDETHPRSRIAASLPRAQLQDESTLDRADAPLPRSLTALEALVRREINIARYAPPAWVLPHEAPDGKPALDVLIAGGGQAGLAIAHGLQQNHVERILVVDENPRGREGPWGTYARMPTLRTHKENGGIELGIPNLSFRAWYETQHGHGAFARLHKIKTADWHTYLGWFRDVIAVPMRNDTRLVRFGPVNDGAEMLFADVTTANGGVERLYARTMVLASGMIGNGAKLEPPFVASTLPQATWAHTHDTIDFVALAEKTVAVMGGGASAYDSAIRAAEAGATVHIYHRQPKLNLLNPGTWGEFNGFLAHYADLSPLEKWRFTRQLGVIKSGPPKATLARALELPNLIIHAGQGWRSVEMNSDRRVLVSATDGAINADFLILGTGYRVDLSACPELSDHHGHIALWEHRFAPPSGEEDPVLLRAPWLGTHFEFTEREPGTAPWLHRVHNFARGAQLSMGTMPIGLSGIKFGVLRLVAGISRKLFLDDRANYLAGLALWQKSDLSHLDT
jgi:cation diffusion facilitator CzcD-associated flavoprotein CzcO